MMQESIDKSACCMPRCRVDHHASFLLHDKAARLQCQRYWHVHLAVHRSVESVQRKLGMLPVHAAACACQ